MVLNNKIDALQHIIESVILPEITGDYVLLDIPYYTNIGDTLIWEGTKSFLEKVPYKCIYSSDMHFFIEQKLEEDVVILLQGGGNFGDIYREHTNFRKRIINLYPNNKIIILPQSVYYEDQANMIEDIAFYSAYSNVIICARDRYSYDFLSQNFNNKVLLAPDLAFFINLDNFSIRSLRKKSERGEKVLFLKRIDSEYIVNQDYNSIPYNAEIHDWPTYERTIFKLKVVDFICRICKLISYNGDISRRNQIEDYKRDRYYRKCYVQLGIDFISKYDVIYTTRLHVLILSILLGKKVLIYDNQTGKIANFYSSWLSDISNVTLLNKYE